MSKGDDYFTCQKCGRLVGKKSFPSNAEKRRAGWDHIECVRPKDGPAGRIPVAPGDDRYAPLTPRNR